MSGEEVHEAKHQPTPPGWANANADVESSHSFIEASRLMSGFDLGDLSGPAGLLAKATVCQNWFNFLRPNSYPLPSR